jgi:hypothetical protein
MQLAHNPITKILFEKLKSNGIPNLQNLMFKKDRIKHFEFKLGDLTIDLTRQLLDEEIKDDLVKLAKASNIKQKIMDMFSGKKSIHLKIDLLTIFLFVTLIDFKQKNG